MGMNYSGGTVTLGGISGEIIILFGASNGDKGGTSGTAEISSCNLCRSTTNGPQGSSGKGDNTSNLYITVREHANKSLS